MKFDFGKYDGWDVEVVVENDRDYSKWILERIKKKEKLRDLTNEIEKWLNEIPPQENDPTVMRFGKYEGLQLSDFVYTDQSYSKWLLEKSNLDKEAPETYKRLEKLYRVFYEEQKQKVVHFYILQFKDHDYVKVGITSQFPLFRLYNYFGMMNFYDDHDIDFKNSFIYKTNDIDIERKALEKFKTQRVDLKTERLNIAVKTLEDYLTKERGKSHGKHFYHKKCVHDFLPFESSQEAKKSFRIKANEFANFTEHYKRYLYKLDLLDQYNPDFYVASEFLN